MAYNTLVQPHLEYASSVWDPYTDELVETIEKIQRRAARFVKSDYRRTSSIGAMINELKWTSTAERRQTNQLVAFHKVIHNQIAVPTNHLKKPNRQIQHLHAPDTQYLQLQAKTDTYKY